MKRILLSICLFALCLSGYSSESPLVKIPRIDADKGNTLFSAEVFNESDWKDAAVIRTFSSCTGLGRISQPTAFYLFHDGATLIAAARCSESDFSDVRAFERRYDDDLTLDESVQLVMGLEDKFEGQLTVGGYEDAYAKIGKCAHTYEMTVNFAGSSNRRYDETPLQNSRFRHRVVKSAGGWCVFFAVPFESVGYDWKKMPLTHFNMFRFYRGERYGWHLPKFGGYNQLPMARAELLDFPRNGEATKEAPVAVAAGSRQQSNAVPVIGRLDMEYYPAVGEVAAEVPSGQAGKHIVLDVNGRSVSASGSSHWPTRLKVPVAFPPGTKFTATLMFDNQVKMRKTFTAKAKAEWRRDVAREYLDSKVPYPWSKPEFAEGRVTLKHGSIDFGEGMLPKAARSSRGKEILAGPIELEFEAGGRKLPVNRRAAAVTTPVAVDMNSAAEPGLEVKSHTEYDGFMTFRVRVAGMKDSVPSAMRLRIPLAKGMAQYLTAGNSQSMVKIGGYGYRGNLKEELWVGSRDGGIIFTFGHYLIYSQPDGRQVEINGDEILITIVSPDGVRPPENNVYEFHLQFTPFRNDYIPPIKADLLFESWSGYQSYPDLSKIPEVRNRVKASRSNDKALYLYFGQVMAENAPEFAQYPTDFMAYPRRPWYQRAYEPGKGVPCSIICFRESAGDFMLDRISRLADETGIGGVYLDGPTVPFWCLNLNHPCSIFLPARWDGSWHEGTVAGQRSYIKRLRGIFDAKGIKNPIWHHTGGGFNLVHFSHCDFFLDGETLSRYRRGYLLPPDVTSIVYSGYPFGYQGVLWAASFFDATFSNPFRRSNIWGLPHGIVSSMVNGANWSSFLDITRRNPDTKFYPYTGEQPHIRTLQPNTLCTSYYISAREAVLISSNIVYDGVQTNAVDVSGMFPGQKLQVRSLTGGQAPDFKDGVLKYTLATREMAVFFIAPESTDASALGLPDPSRVKVALPAPAKLAGNRGFVPADWNVEAGTLGQVAGSALKQGLKTDGKKAMMRYKGSLPDNTALKMKFHHSASFKFHIDGVEISNKYHSTSAGIYHWGGWVIENVHEYDYRDLCDVSPGAFGRNYVVSDRPVDVEIYLIDGRISFFYDGVCVLQHALPKNDCSGAHSFALETQKNDWLAFDVEYLGPASAKDMPVWNHPVL